MSQKKKSDGNGIAGQLMGQTEFEKRTAVSILMDRYRELEIELKRNYAELESIGATVAELAGHSKFWWKGMLVEVEFVDVGKGSYRLKFFEYPSLFDVIEDVEDVPI